MRGQASIAADFTAKTVVLTLHGSAYDSLLVLDPATARQMAEQLTRAADAVGGKA